MKNNIKSILKSIIYGLIIFAGSTYAAKTYYADQIIYASNYGVDKTLDDALDDLYYASSRFANPRGTVISVMSNEAPEGYLICDGKTYNIADYQKLADHIKKQFGSYNYFGGDGTTTFAVPDLRGEFLRGTGTNSHANSGNGANVGTHQESTHQSFVLTQSNNAITVPNVDNYLANADYYGSVTQSNYITTTKNGSYTSIAYYTSRPTNTSVLYCIKY